jgi:hypothetical protein
MYFILLFYLFFFIINSMFQVKSIDITNKEDPKNCELKINWDGIEIIYDDHKLFIINTHIKNLTSESYFSKKKKKNYFNIESYKLVLTCNIFNRQQILEFSVFEDCEHILEWLKKNYRRDTL